MKIIISTIQQSQQRYDTLDDYYVKDGTVHILVSEQSNQDYEMLLAFHALFEQWSAARRGVTEPQITKFDLAFKGAGEPGASPDAPYHPDHVFAERIEREACAHAGIDWDKYSKAIAAVVSRYPSKSKSTVGSLKRYS